MKYLLILIPVWLGCSKVPKRGAPTQISMKSPGLAQTDWNHYLQSVQDDRLLSRQNAQDVMAKFRSLRSVSAQGNVQINQLQSAQRDVEKVAWSYLNETAPSTYMRLGRIMARRFIKAIKERMSLSISMMADGDDERDKRFLSQVGTFTRDALRDGWVPEPMTALTDCMFTALYMSDWMRPVQMRIAIQDYLNPMERYCDLRWQVERAVGLPWTTRLEALKELQALDGYPADYNRIVLLLTIGRIKQATKLLKAFDGPDKAILSRHLKNHGQPR